MAPFVMASINTRVVRRSNALQDWAYGRRFRYREVMGFGDWLAAPREAGAVFAGVAGARARAVASARRASLLDRVLPGAGRGPERGRAREGLLQDRRPRADVERRAPSGARRGPGRPGLQGDRGDARRERRCAWRSTRDQLPDRARAC